MEDIRRWMILTSIAPITWGASYLVTRALLPADAPLWGAVMRALPAGLLLLLVARERPRGSWWWKAPVIGTLTVGAFFVLIYVVAQRLPSGLAATMMATSPAVMMLLAWPMLALRPQARALVGAGLGFVGVCAMLLTGVTGVDPIGVLASLTAMAMASVGFLLTRRWGGEVAVLPSTAWQLVAGGLVVLPFAVAVEGGPPRLDAPALAGFAFLTIVATALAYVLWFGGLAVLSPGTVGLLGALQAAPGRRDGPGDRRHRARASGRRRAGASARTRGGGGRRRAGQGRLRRRSAPRHGSAWARQDAAGARETLAYTLKRNSSLDDDS